jgi:hypothetical protein
LTGDTAAPGADTVREPELADTAERAKEPATSGDEGSAS